MSEFRVACVTGSGRKRVGWHVADSLARRGYAIAVHYHAAASEALEAVQHLESLGTTSAAFQADITDEVAVKRLIDQVFERFSRLDVLVHCAAIWSPQRLETTTASDLRRFWDVNALGAFLCVQHAGLRMVQQPEGGCLVAVGDWATVRPYLDHAAYLVAKAVIPTMTRVMAVELAQRNPRVRVNCILPGPVMLPSTMSAKERNQVVAATLVRREGSPENVAQAVLALVENDFITGVCLPVDGGRTIYAGDA